MQQLGHGFYWQDLKIGARYKIHPPVILLAMAGRGLQRTADSQPSFVGYLGLQFLLPRRPFENIPPTM